MLAKYERGETIPRIEVLKNWYILKVSLDYYLVGEGTIGKQTLKRLQNLEYPEDKKTPLISSIIISEMLKARRAPGLCFHLV